MNWLDVIILLLMVVATVIGLKVGLIKAVLSVAGVVVGVVLAGRYYTGLAAHLTFLPQPGVAGIVAFVIILIAVMIVAAVLATVMKWAVALVMLGWVNRLGGAVFGLVLGAIFCGALLATWVKFVGITDPVRGSAMAKLLLDGFPIVLSLLPGEFDSVRAFFQ